jgi:hypothetical protein
VDRRQLAFTVTAVVLALVLGAGVALLATSGGDEDEASDRPRASTTSTSVAPVTSTTTLAPRPGVTVPTLSPPTVVVIPPTSTTPTTKASKPRRPRRPATTTTAPPTTAPPTTVAPQVVPEEPPTTTAPSTSTSTSTTTTTVPATGEPGVGRTELRLAVVADDAATFDGATAWANSVNRRGGLADRTVRLDLLTTDGTAAGYAAAVAKACEQSFAMVATHSVHDADATPLACGIPDLPVEAFAPEHAQGSSTYPAFPRSAEVASVGPYRWLQTEVEGCCAQYVLVPAEGPDRAATEASIAITERLGFTTVSTPDVDLDASSADYDALAQDLAASDVTFVTSGLGADSTLELRRAAAAAGVTDVPVWYCDARCYFPTFATSDDADGQYVAIETVPFGDRRDVPELRSYLRETIRADDFPSYAGLRAYVAGLLFEEALGPVSDEHGDDGLTRARLLESLASIDAFTGNGLVGATDVGARSPSGCFVLLRVDDGRFARVTPAVRGSLDCGADNLVELDD